LFLVKVPVLSVQRQLVDPKLYMTWRFFAKTLTLDNFLTAKVRRIVVSRFKMPGTQAIKTPIASIAAIIIGKPVSHPPTNVKTPIPKAKMVTPVTNLSISCWILFTLSSSAMRISSI
jgi:hypothetical protein